MLLLAIIRQALYSFSVHKTLQGCEQLIISKLRCKDPLTALVVVVSSYGADVDDVPLIPLHHARRKLPCEQGHCCHIRVDHGHRILRTNTTCSAA